MPLSDKLIKEYKDIFEEKYGRKISDEEAREGAQNLTGLFDILFKQAQIEHRRKLRLKKENVKGFYLDSSEGPYTCSICGANYSGNDIWWNPKGLRCRDCWNNIQNKVIPSLGYDGDNKVWIKEWQLQSDYSLHPATRSKLRRQRVLNGRDLKRGDGTIYCTVYLVKENNDFFRKYSKKPKIKIEFKHK